MVDTTDAALNIGQCAQAALQLCNTLFVIVQQFGHGVLPRADGAVKNEKKRVISRTMTTQPHTQTHVTSTSGCVIQRRSKRWPNGVDVWSISHSNEPCEQESND